MRTTKGKERMASKEGQEVDGVVSVTLRWKSFDERVGDGMRSLSRVMEV